MQFSTNDTPSAIANQIATDIQWDVCVVNRKATAQIQSTTTIAVSMSVGCEPVFFQAGFVFLPNTPPAE
jgi:hypothetical protein